MFPQELVNSSSYPIAGVISYFLAKIEGASPFSSLKILFAVGTHVEKHSFEISPFNINSLIFGFNYH